VSAEWARDELLSGRAELEEVVHPEGGVYFRNRRTRKEGAAKVAQEPFLDAQVTGWNMRDKKIAGCPITFVDKGTVAKELGYEDTREGRKDAVGRHHFVPVYEQSRYKYLIYVEGHCAANRYAFLMRLGSVIFKVDSRCVADEMWMFPSLEALELAPGGGGEEAGGAGLRALNAADGGADHIAVKADLSDLREKVEWCRAHDRECEVIARNCTRKYERLVGKEAIFDYMEVMTHEIRYMEDGGGGAAVESAVALAPASKHTCRNVHAHA
jgi:hypothetical protein